MNMGDEKILNKILVNWIQEATKKIIYHNQFGFVTEMQGWVNICKSIRFINYINGLKDRNHMVISVDSEKNFDKIKYLFILKVLKESGIRISLSQH